MQLMEFNLDPQRFHLDVAVHFLWRADVCCHDKTPSFRRYMDFNATFAAGSAVQHHRGFDASSEAADAASTRSSGVRAGVTLAVRTAPANTYFGMGLGKNGGLLDTWFAGRSTEAQWASWIVFDFGFEVSIDGLKLHTYGDGLHEPVKRPPPTNLTVQRDAGGLQYRRLSLLPIQRPLEPAGIGSKYVLTC